MSNKGGYAARSWYQPRAADLACNQHPQPTKALIRALSKHTHMSEGTSSHIIDRLLHLSYCCQELETITLRRLQPGSNQPVKPRPSFDG